MQSRFCQYQTYSAFWKSQIFDPDTFRTGPGGEEPYLSQTSERTTRSPEATETKYDQIVCGTAGVASYGYPSDRATMN